MELTLVRKNLAAIPTSAKKTVRCKVVEVMISGDTFRTTFQLIVEAANVPPISNTMLMIPVEKKAEEIKPWIVFRSFLPSAITK